ncbi:MAG: NUDIX domain-containing protein [Candidatus Thorarchaeota archaeon]
MGSREYSSQALVGVGAIVVGQRGLLLVRRDKDPGEGRWSIPGGLIELGETQIEAVSREVHEETGISVDVLNLLSTADVIIRDDDDRIKFHYVLNHYLARALDEDTRPEYPKAEVDWFSFSDLQSLDVPEMIHQLLRKHSLAIDTTYDKYY